MVGELDDVEVVLNDDDGIAAVYQPLQHVHQNADVLEVESRGGFVKDVEGLARVFLRQFRSQFDALAFAARECRGGLSQFDVPQSDILYGLDFPKYFRHVLKELHSLVDGHVEHVGNRLTLEEAIKMADKNPKHPLKKKQKDKKQKKKHVYE